MFHKTTLHTAVKALLCAVFFLWGNAMLAQHKTILRGSVRDAKGRGIEHVSVLLNGALHAVSDKTGAFVFHNLSAGEYAYTASCMGYADVQGKVVLQSDADNVLPLVMSALTLQLAEVTVTARQRSIGTVSVIGQEAIRHLQPKSVADLLQLLPGALTVNPSLNTVAQASLRETSTDANNALGTAVIIDGAPLSNDANLQVLSTSKTGANASTNADGMNQQTTASRGVDLRSMSAENIERMEVIRGIPSVEYGNLTSGVVILKTKRGKTPLEAKLKADPFSKLLYLGKGIAWGRYSTFNAGVDYSQSYPDTRRRYRGFDRITASASYGTLLGAAGAHPVSFNLSGAFYSNINQYKSDTQLRAMGLWYRNENVGGRLAVNGDVKFNGFVTALNYDASVQLARMLDVHETYVSNPDGVVTDSRLDGESQARFLTRTYTSRYTIEGIPYHLYFRIKANRYIQLGTASFTDVKAGAEYTLDGNQGKGLVFDIASPPQSTGMQTLRPRSYRDVPALGSFSAFIENNASVRLGAQRLQLMTGVRAAMLLLDESKARMASIVVFEPRINAEYTFLSSQNNRVFDKLSLTVGWGLANKMPPLLYLYPDNAYFDNQSLSYKGSGSDAESLAIITTKVVSQTQNPQLQPTRSTTLELGLNARVGKISGYITFSREVNRREYGFDAVPEFLAYRAYQVPVGATSLSYQPGNVQYTLGGNRQTAAVSMQNEIATWHKPANNRTSEKTGLEYAFNLGTCRRLATSLNIDGAWFHIKRKDTSTSLQYINKLYGYIGVLPAGSGSLSERFNTNFRFITHLSALKMVFTTTLQVVWYEQTNSFYETKEGKPAYHLSADGTQYVVSPLGYYNRFGAFRQWLPGNEADPSLNLLANRYLLSAFKADRVKPWALLNFRLTKELGKLAEVSFMANNFLNISRYHTNRHTLGRRELYPDLYFGAELKLKL